MKNPLRPALCAALLAALPAHAEEPAPLDAIVVVDTRAPQPAARAPAAVSIITRDMIEASGAQSLADVLRATGVVQVTDFFGDGSRAQLDLRAFGDGAHATTLVLVDGRRLNNPDVAPPDLASLSLKDVERIEIIAGSAAALYGDQAIGGVINIVTRAPQDFAIDLELGAGSFAAHQARAAVEGRAGVWSYRVSGEARGSDNYRAHNRRESYNGLARLGYDWSSGDAFVEGGLIEEDLETPGALFAEDLAQDRRQSRPQFANDFSDTTTTTQRLGLRQRLGAHWTLHAEQTYRRLDGVFRLAFGTTPAAQDSRQERELASFNPRVVGRHALPAGELVTTLGLDLQRADYALSSPFGTQSNRQHQADVYGQAMLPLARTLDLTLGLRHGEARNKVLDGFTFTEPTTLEDRELAGEAGLAWRFAEGWRSYLRVADHYRFAKVEEFTGAGAPPASNTNPLRTQTGTSWEGGLEWLHERFSARASLYRLEADDEIAFDPTSFSSINLPATRRDGALVDLRWQALQRLTLALAGQYVDAQVTQGAFAGRDVPLAAARTGRAAVELALPAGLSAYVETVGVGRRAFAGDFDNSLSRLPGHAATHLALQGGWGAWRLTARVNNLLDREYSEYGSSAFDATFTERESFFPSPERNVWIGVRYAMLN